MSSQWLKVCKLILKVGINPPWKYLRKFKIIGKAYSVFYLDINGENDFPMPRWIIKPWQNHAYSMGKIALPEAWLLKWHQHRKQFSFYSNQKCMLHDWVVMVVTCHPEDACLNPTPDSYFFFLRKSYFNPQHIILQAFFPLMTSSLRLRASLLTSWKHDWGNCCSDVSWLYMYSSSSLWISGLGPVSLMVLRSFRS